MTRKYYIVWNADKTEGFVTADYQIAYEARKGSDSNCYNIDGKPSCLAMAFCDITCEENCTVEEINLTD
jgi:hypothetical protein